MQNYKCDNPVHPRVLLVWICISNRETCTRAANPAMHDKSAAPSGKIHPSSPWELWVSWIIIGAECQLRSLRSDDGKKMRRTKMQESGKRDCKRRAREQQTGKKKYKCCLKTEIKPTALIYTSSQVNVIYITQYHTSASRGFIRWEGVFGVCMCPTGWYLHSGM